MGSVALGTGSKPHWMLLGGKVFRRNSALIPHFIRVVNSVRPNEDRRWIYMAFPSCVSQKGTG